MMLQFEVMTLSNGSRFLLCIDNCSGTPTTNAGSAPAACASAQSTSHTAA